jgi:hypothetical protein
MPDPTPMTICFTFPQPSPPPSKVIISAFSYRLTVFLVHIISSTLRMEVTHSSETSVYNKPTRHKLTKGILHCNRHENLKAYHNYNCLGHREKV